MKISSIHLKLVFLDLTGPVKFKHRLKSLWTLFCFLDLTGSCQIGNIKNCQVNISNFPKSLLWTAWCFWIWQDPVKFKHRLQSLWTFLCFLGLDRILSNWKYKTLSSEHFNQPQKSSLFHLVFLDLTGSCQVQTSTKVPLNKLAFWTWLDPVFLLTGSCQRKVLEDHGVFKG